MHPGLSDLDTLAQKGDAKDGLVALEDSGIGGGALVPNEVLVRGTAPEGVASALASVDGISGAIAPSDPSWRRHGSAIVLAFPIEDGSSGSWRTVVDDVRSVAHAQGGDVGVGGQPSQNNDFIDAVYGNFPLMLALVGIVTFLLLARAFRSVLLPAKAVILNVLSVAAAWGVLVIVWQNGHGSEAIWGIPASGSIESWIPLMVFAFLFGLSMDYEVFILSRMREEYDNTGDTNEAVVVGIGRTGRLVTSAALILFLAFMSLASSPGTQIKVLATGLGGRHPARRDRDPRAARARGRVAVRAGELVAAGLVRARPARRSPRTPTRACPPAPSRRLRRSSAQPATAARNASEGA